MEIIAETLADAHEGAVDAIMTSHAAQGIQTHHDKVEETIEFRDSEGSPDILVIKVTNPGSPKQVSEASAFHRGFVEAYKKQFLSLTPKRADGKQASYTYWNRHNDHPKRGVKCLGGILGFFSRLLKCPEIVTHGDGDGMGYKQIDSIIQKFVDDPRTRRAISVTYDPEIDMNSQDPPCMILAQFIIRDGKMDSRFFFRSQDMLTGAGMNLVGCNALHGYVLTGVNRARMGKPAYSRGTLTLISTIPHIYPVRDAPELNVMSEHIARRKKEGTWTIIQK